MRQGHTIRSAEESGTPTNLHPHRPDDVHVAVPDVSLDAELRERLASTRVAVIGCGGLGSNVAEMLVRSGVGALTLVDFDVVETDNLNRQFFFRDQVGEPKTEALAANLRRIRPSVELRLVLERVTEANLLALVVGADVVVEAVDTAEAKAMILNTCLRVLPGVPLVTASGLAGYGSTNAIVVERMAENLYVVGDLTSEADAGHPLFASRVIAAAAAQAHVVVRVLLGYPEP